MVGVNSFIHQLGTVALVATFCVAIQLRGDRGLLDFEPTADFELECDGVKNSWTVSEDSPGKKVLILAPELNGCFKSKNTVSLNSTTPVSFTFYREAPKEESGKILMRLVPKTGSCPDEECVWDIVNDPKFKAGEWITAEYKFPLKSIKDCYLEVQVDKSKGKFLADKISVPNVAGQKSGSISGAQEAEFKEIILPNYLVPVDGNGTGGGGGGGSTTAKSTTSSSDILEISRNLILTTASLLTLNVILN